MRELSNQMKLKLKSLLVSNWFKKGGWTASSKFVFQTDNNKNIWDVGAYDIWI